MKLLTHLFLLVGLALALNSCTASRALRRAHQAAADEALELLEANAKKTPEQQLQDVIEAHPSLAQKVTKIVRVVDTVRVPAAAAGLSVAPVANPEADRALADSLLAVLKKLNVTDSVLSQARQHAAVAALAAKLGAARPLYPRDTQRVRVGDLEVKAWFDGHSQLQVVATSDGKNIAVAKETLELAPIRQLTRWELFVEFVKMWWWLLLVALIFIIVFVYRKARRDEK